MKIVTIVFCTFVLALASGAYAQSASDTQPQTAAQQKAAQQQLQRDQQKMQQDQQRLEQDWQALEQDQAQQISTDDQQQLEKQAEQASKEMQQAAQRMAQLSLQMQGPMIARMSHMFDPNRAVLGISIADSHAPQKTPGVQVLAVTPGGPAERAGLRNGDTITSINGKALSGNAEQTPADQLMEFMDKVKPGDVLKLGYMRNRQDQSAAVKAGQLSDYNFFYVRDGRDQGTTVKSGRPSDYNFALVEPPSMLVRPENLLAPFPPGGWGAWGNMQLTQLTPGLGQYFGTDKGLLVVRAPRDAALKLQDGDVILKIGDRKPVTPSEAMRIFYSYTPGETVTLHILRRGKPLSLGITAPQNRDIQIGPYPPMDSHFQ